MKFLRTVPTLRLRDYRDEPCLMEHVSGLAVFCGTRVKTTPFLSFFWSFCRDN